MAILGNVLAIRALWKASSISFSMKALFLSLAVSDLLVGLFPQPMFAIIPAVMLNVAHSDDYSFDFLCPTVISVFWFCFLTLASSSFLCVTAIAMDRFLAVSLHLRYRELVTPQRVFVAVIVLWITSVVSGAIYISIPKYNDIVVVFLEVNEILVTTVAYLQIYRVVRRHNKQIRCHHQALSDHAVIEAARQNKSALNAFYVYAIFLGCFLPSLTFTIVIEALEYTPVFVLVAHHFAGTVICLNSAINPFIYCWRYRDVCKMVKKSLMKICMIWRSE